MNILLAGHFDREVAPSLGFTDPRALAAFGGIGTDEALAQLAAGLTDGAPGVSMDVLPWGPGPVFVETLSDALPGWWLASAGRDGLAWIERPGAGPLLIEMGHDQDNDGGDRIVALLEERGLLDGSRPIVVASSTSRSLLGPGGTDQLGPDLSLRRSAPRGRPLPTRSAYLPGGGAGGGAAARLVEGGAEIAATGEALARHLDLRSRLERADLVVVLHPFWHAPDLADAPEGEILEMASGLGLPVVGVGMSASLSAPEMADAGVNGIHLVRQSGGFLGLGRRVAQTWLPNYAR